MRHPYYGQNAGLPAAANPSMYTIPQMAPGRQIPTLYGQTQSSPYQNFYQQPISPAMQTYAPPVSVPPSPIVIARPTITHEKYAWAPRTSPMEWKLAESINVDQIVRTGDVDSVRFYMEKFVKSNLTNEDQQQFGSKAALNAFLIMQLGIDYLLNQEAQAPRQAAEADAQMAANYEAQIATATQTVMQYKDRIALLQKQVEQLHEDRRKEKHVIDLLRQKLKKERSKRLKDTTEEPGAIKDGKLTEKITDTGEDDDKLSEGEINTQVIKKQMSLQSSNSSADDTESEGEADSSLMEEEEDVN